MTVIDDVKTIDCGKVTDIKWPGGVSAKKRLALDDMLPRLDDFYVKVNPGAKTRCIDGRHDPELDERNLGPQVPGGAPGAALAYRLGVDESDIASGTFLSDAEAMISNYLRLGFAPGGHRDEYSHGRKSVGCGAIDGMDRILATMTDPGLVNDHKRVVRAILGNDFDRDTYLRVMGAAVTVNGRAKEYFRDREAILDVLEKKAKKSTAVLKGDHQECLVIVNLIHGTTLLSNKFAHAYGGIQAFGYDLWWSVELANKLLPMPDQALHRQRFIMARVMTTVATLMALTDGSQQLILRTPAVASPDAEEGFTNR